MSEPTFSKWSALKVILRMVQDSAAIAPADQKAALAPVIRQAQEALNELESSSPAPVVAEVRRAPIDLDEPHELSPSYYELAVRMQQAEAEVARLKRTWLKIRTWLVIQSRHRAGESAEDLATDYNVPVEWVRFVLFPENDLDARYGRPSDRVKTSRERAEKAEADLAALRTRLRGLEQQWQPIETAPRDVECLFWVVAKTPEESWCDTSGKSIFTGGSPRLEKCRYGGWSSLSKGTHWMPLPKSPDELARLLTTPEEP